MFDNLTDIQIETTTACPAKCLCCPLRQMKRPGGRMSDRLLNKILEEIVQMGNLNVHPYLNGEPFADDRQWEILSYLSANPSVVFTYYSNMECLTKSKIDELFLYPIAYFNASFNASTPESYKINMGLNHFDENVEKIRYFGQKNRELGYPIGFSISMVEFDKTKDEVEAFRKLFEGLPADKTDYKNWGGKEEITGGDKKPLGKPTIACPRMVSNLTILWDGRVNLCCMDNEGEVIIGDLNRETIWDVWKNNQQMRDNMRNSKNGAGKLPVICQKCNLIRR
jgi:radical SAM protein with 4Fe4S-binding SPASM domain